MKNVPGIEYSKSKRNPTMESIHSFYTLSIYKDADYFSSPENLDRFIKDVERCVRRSKYYKRYVKFIREDVGLNMCQVLSNLEIPQDTLDSPITLEMHHGPILTLYDYVLIVIDYLLNTDFPKITTFRVADIIMREHYEHNIQVVMLSKTSHEAVDNGLFINYKQGFGNLDQFIRNYKEGLSYEQIQKINSYVDMCEQYDSFDNNLFMLQNDIKSWAKEEVF